MPPSATMCWRPLYSTSCWRYVKSIQILYCKIRNQDLMKHKNILTWHGKSKKCKFTTNSYLVLKLWARWQLHIPCAELRVPNAAAWWSSSPSRAVCFYKPWQARSSAGLIHVILGTWLHMILAHFQRSCMCRFSTHVKMQKWILFKCLMKSATTCASRSINHLLWTHFLDTKTEVKHVFVLKTFGYRLYVACV